MHLNSFKKKLVAVSIAAVLSPLANAVSVSNTFHNDSRQSVKLDLQPSHVVSKNLTGESLATQFLSQNKEKYALESNFSNLKLVKVQPSLTADHYRFQQFLNGVSVDKAEIIVSVSKQNQVVRVFNNTFPVLKTPELSKNTINKNDAAEKAWDYLQASGSLYSQPKTELVYVNVGANFELAYKVNMAVSAPQGDWEFYINADNSAVIKAHRIDLPISKNANQQTDGGKRQAFPTNKNHIAFVDALAKLAKTQDSKLEFSPQNKADATALVFNTNPVIDLNDDTLEDNSAASEFNSAYVTKTLKDVTLDNGVYRLVGPWVNISSISDELPATPPSTTTDGSWTAKRGDNAFNDAMTYFHIDQNQRYMQSLGFVDGTGIQFVSIEVDTDGINGEDQSHFRPSTNQLAFGHGCVDDNEDSDVILHEYGHAINRSINSNFGGGDTGAMGEGFGDYWAVSYRYSTPSGVSFHPDWVFSWDGHNNCWGGRSVNKTSYRYDPTKTYGAHATVNGESADELWSTPLAQSLLELMNAGVSRDEVDQIILEAQFGLGSGLKMPDMAAAIVSAANTLFPAGQHAAVFNSHFKTMNILGDPLEAEAVSIIAGGNNDIADPGETVTFNIPLKNNGGVAVSQVSSTLSTSVAGVTLSSATSSYPDISGSSSATNQTAYELTIPANHSCGDGIELSMAVDFTEGSAQSSTFDVVLPVGASTGNTTTVSAEPGTSIPDNNTAGITEQITFAGASANSSITMDVNITHTWRGDLALTLTSPAGTSVILQSTKSDSAANIVGNYPNDLTPEESLSAFDGEDHNGVWSLKVVDGGAEDIGTLNSWAINSLAPACDENNAPTASVVNSTLSVDENDSVTLDASPSSDSDGDAITFAWTQTSGTSVNLTNATSAQASFTAPDLPATEDLVFEVTVTDAKGASDTATVTVTVNDSAGNESPVANVASSEITVTEGDSVTLDSSTSSDPNGDTLTHAWTQASGTNVTLANANTSQASFTAATAGSYSFTVTVTDPAGATDTSTVNVTVNAPNSAPTASVASETITANEGNSVTLNGSSSTDPDGDTLTYAWVQTSGTSVSITNSTSASASFTAPQVSATSTLAFELTVSDPSGASDTASVTVTVNDVPASSGGGGSFGWLSLGLLALLRRAKK